MRTPKKVIIKPEPQAAWAQNMQRFRWVEPDYKDELSRSVSDRYYATSPAFVSNKGMLIIAHGNTSEEQPISKIRAISFVPSPDGDTKADMFVFIIDESRRNMKGSKPTYMGTFDINEPQFEETESLLRGLGIGVGKLFKTKISN